MIPNIHWPFGRFSDQSVPEFKKKKNSKIAENKYLKNIPKALGKIQHPFLKKILYKLRLLKKKKKKKKKELP